MIPKMHVLKKMSYAFFLVCSVSHAVAARLDDIEQSTTQSFLSSLTNYIGRGDVERATRLLGEKMSYVRTKPGSWDERYEIREALLKVLPTLSLTDMQRVRLLTAITLPDSKLAPDERDVAADVALLRRGGNYFSAVGRGPDYQARLAIYAEELRLWCQLPPSWQKASSNFFHINWDTNGALPDFDAIFAIARKSTCSPIDPGLFFAIATTLYFDTIFTSTFGGATSISEDNPSEYAKQTGDSVNNVRQRIRSYLSLANFLYQSDRCKSCTPSWRKHILASAAAILWWLGDKDEARKLVLEAVTLTMLPSKIDDQLTGLTDVLNVIGFKGFGYGPSDIELVKIVAEKIFYVAKDVQSQSATEAKYYAEHHLKRFEAQKKMRK